MMVLSDIHSEEPGKKEFYSKYLSCLNDSKVLILAGDIGTFKERDNLKEFLTFATTIYSNVLWVPGNHDYDGIAEESDFDNLVNEVNFVSRGKLHLLNRSIVTLNISGKSIVFAGCTLWTNAGWNRNKSRDAHLNSNERQLLHIRDKNWLKDILKNIHPDVVITHHPPISLTNSSLKEYYSNNLDELLPKVRVWIFGHLHQSYQIRENGCLLISNPVGRFKDDLFFRQKFISLSNF